MTSSDPHFWKSKLAAYLHDPPSKCLDIATHGARSASAFQRVGIFNEEEIHSYVKQADWTAAAADRIPFPKSQVAGVTCRFDGVQNAFRHPLNGASQIFFDKPLEVTLAEEIEQSVQPAPDVRRLPVEEQVRAVFFATWRLWPHRCAERDWRMAFLPADTRLPDHSIWTHLSLVSALAGCAESSEPGAALRPALLKFQLGPVQDFIAAARNTRDLWSGSFLLSWLMAAGLKALAMEVGPDAVIFPNLRGVPLFDLHLRDDLWRKVREHEGASDAWEALSHSTEALLTPNLPNIFLAVVPEDRAEQLAGHVSASIGEEWKRISASVWAEREALQIPEKMAARFDEQTKRFLETSWQVTRWAQDPGEMRECACQLPGGNEVSRVTEIFKAFTNDLPVGHRDPRFYADPGSLTLLNNVGLTWSLAVALAGWQLDAVRQLRAFEGWASGGWASGRAVGFNAKDALNGREEMIVGGRQWRESLGEPWATLFKHDDPLGASSLIKRVWHRTYLAKIWGFRAEDFRMPSVLDIARGQSNEDSSDDNLEKASGDPKYFAVLAFDGDSIGAWVSGEKCPAFGDQLADYASAEGSRAGVRGYFACHSPKLLEIQRPLSPSYHLQFSEALSNFAGRCAGRIVKHFGGRLIYSGGDDVLALLPASRVFDCAKALDRAFRGLEPLENVGLGHRSDGFLYETENDGTESVFLVPGPSTSGSVGIAIAHVKAPIQDVVRAAQAAEKRAKRLTEGKHAVGVTLFKRSGETTEWIARFESEAGDCSGRHGLSALAAIQHAMNDQAVSGKFPHRLIELIEPYCATSGRRDAPDFSSETALAILERELATTLERQRCHGANAAVIEQVRETVTAYARNIVSHSDNGKPTECFERVIGLCTVAAFLKRQPESER